MDARDVALQHSAPVVTVPRYGGFTPLVENGHRFLVTGDGLWLEARRPWMYLRVPSGSGTEVMRSFHSAASAAAARRPSSCSRARGSRRTPFWHITSG